MKQSNAHKKTSQQKTSNPRTTKSRSTQSGTTQGRQKKLELHPRNPHRMRYDFALLADSCPQLTAYIYRNPYGNESIDFANPDAVKTLNQALLNHFYGVSFWDLPHGFLCPPIPGRADYIHYVADLLAESNQGVIPRGASVRVLDVGVGANCVYPIIGNREYGWHFVGSDINTIAIDAANVIIRSNKSLKQDVSTRLQENRKAILNGIVLPNERFDVVMCNPPFHASEKAMQEESARKWRGVNASGKSENRQRNAEKGGSNLNFGGQANELWCEGGELAFIQQMVRESQAVKDQCFWFTSLVSRQSNLAAIENSLKSMKPTHVKIIEMAQGQKISRFIAWSFLESPQQDYWQDTYWAD